MDNRSGGPSPSLAGLRVAIIYDCFFPLTVGGAERWYRFVAEQLIEAGAQVTYLTRRQWAGEAPRIPGMSVVAVSGADDLYDDRGVRRLGPPLRFGFGVGRYLIGHRHDFDVVEVANFPFWSLLAVRLSLARAAVPAIVDWYEIWSLAFWRSYAGPAKGFVGFAVQRLCAAVSEHPIVASPRNRSRLRAAGCRAEATVLAGYLPSEITAAAGDHLASLSDHGPEPVTTAERPFALFVGRHIHDKGVDLVGDVAAELGKLDPAIELLVAGDGPGRRPLEAEVVARGLAVRCIGFVSDGDLTSLFRGAACLLLLSRREGYGLVVIEAARHGTPVVVAGFEENLATDNVDDGRNGYVAYPPDPPTIARRVVDVVRGGEPLRRSTVAWYQDAVRSSHSTEQILGLYARLSGMS